MKKHVKISITNEAFNCTYCRGLLLDVNAIEQIQGYHDNCHNQIDRYENRDRFYLKLIDKLHSKMISLENIHFDSNKNVVALK